MIKNRIFTLPQTKMPNKWINILYNIPKALTPLIDPATNQPVPIEVMLQLFSESLIMQEVNTKDEFIDIPEEVLRIYSLYRPT
ncbi:MAG: TrpB-like pyridoxal-phosphate dependent enzyme, partial [Spirochaetes bacterium]|nr:TrpB-like pyridoxal-phosphate dependent enzyme [Spirochaetota bacterium]